QKRLKRLIDFIAGLASQRCPYAAHCILVGFIHGQASEVIIYGGARSPRQSNALIRAADQGRTPILPISAALNQSSIYQPSHVVRQRSWGPLKHIAPPAH